MAYSQYLRSLNSTQALVAKDIGGKALSLNMLSKNGIRIPEGRVLTTNAFNRFVEYNNLKQKTYNYTAEFNHENKNALKKFTSLREQFIKGKFPKDMQKEIMDAFRSIKCQHVAVRSSAVAEDSSTASWAGQLDSFTYTNKNTLLENIKKCWASIFSVHALHYKQHKKLDIEDFSIGVIIQKMVHSNVSGVAFSVHPVTKADIIVIEAGLGLCESLVNGEIDPDRYIFDKNKKILTEKNIGNQSKYRTFISNKKVWRKVSKKLSKNQKISDAHLNVLVSNIIKIEIFSKHPVDVEWALEKDTLYILQARPITS